MTEKQFELEYGLDFLRFVKQKEKPSKKPPKPLYKSILDPSFSPALHSPKNSLLPILNDPTLYNRSQRIKSPELQTDFKQRYNLFNKKSEQYFKPLINLKQAKIEEEFFLNPNHKLKKLSVSPTHNRALEFLQLNKQRSDSKDKKERDLIYHEENLGPKQSAIAQVFHPIKKRNSRSDLAVIKTYSPEVL